MRRVNGRVTAHGPPPSPGPGAVVDAARSPLTSPAALDQLSRSDYIFIVEAVAQNPSTPTGTLRHLLPDTLGTVDWRDPSGDARVAMALMGNPRCPDDVQASAARSIMKALEPNQTGMGFAAIVSLFSRDAVARPLLEELLEMATDHRTMRRVVAKETQLEWVKAVLRSDPSGRVRAAAGG